VCVCVCVCVCVWAIATAIRVFLGTATKYEDCVRATGTTSERVWAREKA